MDKETKSVDLSVYRINNASETLDTAKLCMDNKRYKDAINRCYYAAFYAVKAVLALEETDFKRHKDAVAYFNQNYVATDIFDREIGKRLGRLKRKRETSDYDDFYVASCEEAKEQYEAAELIVKSVQSFLKEKEALK
ncbi:MAG: HEPN domain-containing protein [Eubacteriales bacterium]|nr:HEPN domain-containing protein [Eubacteriales bacterium]